MSQELLVAMTTNLVVTGVLVAGLILIWKKTKWAKWIKIIIAVILGFIILSLVLRLIAGGAALSIGALNPQPLQNKAERLQQVQQCIDKCDAISDEGQKNSCLSVCKQLNDTLKKQ